MKMITPPHFIAFQIAHIHNWTAPIKSNFEFKRKQSNNYPIL